MQKALFNTVYNRKKCLLSNGTALVQIEVYSDKRKKYFSTGLYITPDQWDNKRKRVKNHVNANGLNKQIKDFTDNLERIELDLRASGKVFTLEKLADHLAGRCTNDFLKFMETEINDCTLENSTKQSQRITFNRLKEFRSHILIEEVDVEFLTKFERWLIKVKGVSVNTVNKYMRHVRKFINLAIDRDMLELNKYPFRGYKAKSESTEREHLAPEELERIESLELPTDKKHLQKAIDMYLFCCYTGLRFSDIIRLKPEHITTENGQTWLDIRMQKTKETLRLPLDILFKGRSIEILQRNIIADRRYIFDDLTNQAINRNLKDIAGLAGIKKCVTFHTARHTCATFLLYKGVSMSVIQKILGHKKAQTTQIYAKVIDKTVLNELKAVEF